jgi:hypothetical protein
VLNVLPELVRMGYVELNLLPDLVQVGVVVLDQLAALLLHQNVEGLVHAPVKS